jgi:hypothetical protein
MFTACRRGVSDGQLRLAVSLQDHSCGVRGVIWMRGVPEDLISRERSTAGVNLTGGGEAPALNGFCSVLPAGIPAPLQGAERSWGAFPARRPDERQSGLALN